MNFNICGHIRIQGKNNIKLNMRENQLDFLMQTNPYRVFVSHVDKLIPLLIVHTHKKITIPKAQRLRRELIWNCSEKTSAQKKKYLVAIRHTHDNLSQIMTRIPPYKLLHICLCVCVCMSNR